MKKIKNIITLLAMTTLAFSMTAMGEDSLQQGDDSLQVGNYAPSKRGYDPTKLKIETRGEQKCWLKDAQILIQQNVQLKNKDTKEDIAESLTKASSLTSIEGDEGSNIKMPSVNGNMPLTYYTGSKTTINGKIILPELSPKKDTEIPIFWNDPVNNCLCFDDRVLTIQIIKDTKGEDVHTITLVKSITDELTKNPIQQ